MLKRVYNVINTVLTEDFEMEIKLCAFADEYSSELSKQIDALCEFDIPYLELRGVDGKNVTAWELSDAKNWKKQLDQKGIKVWSIGSPLGKIKLDDPFDAHLATAEKLFQMANSLECENVRMFSFYTSEHEKDRDEVFEKLAKMVSLAEKYGVVLCHENEKGIWGDLAPRCLEISDRLPEIKTVFDPANYVQCGQDIESALKMLEDRIYYYHIKDALYEDGAVVPAGAGDGRLKEMLSGIKTNAVLTLEPHLRVFKGYSDIDDTKLKNKYEYESAEKAFGAAVDALETLLSSLGYKKESRVWKR